MSFADAYLEKVSLDPSLDIQAPSKDLSMVVAIPACNEPDILKTLSSLLRCGHPRGAVEIIILINAAESARADVLTQNQLTESAVLAYASTHHEKRFRVLVSHVPVLPDRNAGGAFYSLWMQTRFARKITLLKQKGNSGTAQIQKPVTSISNIHLRVGLSRIQSTMVSSSMNST